MESPYKYTIDQVVKMLNDLYERAWITKLCQRGEVGQQAVKNYTWLLSDKDVEYLRNRRFIRGPGRPRLG